MDFKQTQSLADQSGDAFFVFDESKFRKNFQALKASFAANYQPVNIGYSYKTNYTPYLCKIVHELGGFAEVVSVMEYNLARRLGVPGERIIFNGPCKGQNEFNEAASLGVTLNLDSARDVHLAQTYAKGNPEQKARVVLRCNFELRNNQISRFGMYTDGDEFRNALQIVKDSPALHLQGLHCHFPDRDLDSYAIRTKKMVRLAKQIFVNKPPETLNIGGGYFSNMPETMRRNFESPPATFDDYGMIVGNILTKAYPDKTNRPTLFLEPGTAIVADTFSFFTKVLSTREIRGRIIATTTGSMFDISPNARSRNLPVTVISNCMKDEISKKHYDITGYTCIESDLLTKDFQGAIASGDWIRYDNVGSYSVVMRPPFILPARAIFAKTLDGQFKFIKQPQSIDDVFANFVI